MCRIPAGNATQRTKDAGIGRQRDETLAYPGVWPTQKHQN